MASLWRKSHEVIRDNNDARAAGALLYFFEAGTTTALVTYSDNALSSPRTHPVVCDAYGRAPAIFLGTGSNYKERVETATGALLWETDSIDPAPAVEEAPSGTVDSADLLDCGDVIWRAQSGTRTGWIRLNGQSIGSAASAASERANDDTEDLYTLLWNSVSDSVCAVSSGRGASAAADFAANKTLTLPDLRGRSPFGLDDMGASLAGRLAAVTFAVGNRQTVGGSGGVDTVTLTSDQMPFHTHTATVTDPGHSHSISGAAAVNNNAAGSGSVANAATTGPVVTGGAATGITVSNSSTGGGNLHTNMPPFILGTWYMKLARLTV